MRAQPKALHKKIIDLVERDGHQLFGMWHSHIMRGPETTHPSGVDLAQMQRFVDGGWDQVIGGIFNLTGHVRLFSTAHDFDLKLYGAGVEIISDHPREKLLKIAMVS